MRPQLRIAHILTQEQQFLHGAVPGTLPRLGRLPVPSGCRQWPEQGGSLVVCLAPHLAAGYCPADLYLDTLAPGASRAGMARVLTRLARRLDCAPGQACPWHRLTHGALVAAWGGLLEHGYAVKTLRAARCAIHGVIRQQAGLGLIDLVEERRLLLAVPIVRGSSDVAGRALTADEVGRLLAAVTAHEPHQIVRDRALVSLLYATGLRGAELCGLRWPTDVMSDLRELRVHGKGHRDRRAYVMDETALAALADWLVVRGDAAGPLFTRVTTGGYARLTMPLLTGGLRRIVGAAGRAAGLGRVTSHDLRRTMATLLADKIPIDVLATLLGHASIETTRLYIRRDDTQLRAAARRLPQLGGSDGAAADGAEGRGRGGSEATGEGGAGGADQPGAGADRRRRALPAGSSRVVFRRGAA